MVVRFGDARSFKQNMSSARSKRADCMDGDTVKLLVAVLGFGGGIGALITAIVSRRKEIVNRREVIHHHRSDAVPDRAPHPGFTLHRLALWGFLIALLVTFGGCVAID